MNKLFNTIRVQRPPRNMFDLSHERKWTGNMGYLTPIFCQEVLPGDNWSVKCENLMRLTPLQSPMMQRVRQYTSYYFIPTRIMWNPWEKFITGGPDGTSAPVMPYITFEEPGKIWLEEGSLADYMGIPLPEVAITAGAGIKVNILPFRAYQMVYNDYYRDQNLIPEMTFDKDLEGDQSASAPEVALHMTLRQPAWQKDIFTSALPNTQRGGQVAVPGTGGVPLFPARATDVNGNNSVATGPMNVTAGSSVDVGGTNVGLRVLNELSIAIRDFRKANRLQMWLEKNAIAGSRLFEYLQMIWGVRSSDARLQRPEFLGGASSPIVISEVLSTFQQADDLGYPQGTMTGHAINVNGNAGFKRRFEEHGYIIGVTHVLPTTGYQQGLPNMYQRENKFDFALPDFAQIGEEPIKNGELYWDFTSSDAENRNTFGYRARYMDYKFVPNSTHGNFRTSLAYWHQNRIFANRPNLNASFVTADPTPRIYAVTDPAQHHLLVNTYHSARVVRSLPLYGTPTL